MIRSLCPMGQCVRHSVHAWAITRHTQERTHICSFPRHENEQSHTTHTSTHTHLLICTPWAWAITHHTHEQTHICSFARHEQKQSHAEHMNKRVSGQLHAIFRNIEHITRYTHEQRRACGHLHVIFVDQMLSRRRWGESPFCLNGVEWDMTLLWQFWYHVTIMAVIYHYMTTGWNQAILTSPISRWHDITWLRYLTFDIISPTWLGH